MVESGQGPAASQGGELAHARLREMAQMEPRYERNLPKLCSFYARGECDRGSSCPFRHEMPRDRADPMSKVRRVEGFWGRLFLMLGCCFRSLVVASNNSNTGTPR
jgi:pre-mRNA-splicing factor RBM22/SLT11